MLARLVSNSTKGGAWDGACLGGLGHCLRATTWRGLLGGFLGKVKDHSYQIPCAGWEIPAWDRRCNKVAERWWLDG